MAITLKKKGAAVVTVEHKHAGVVTSKSEVEEKVALPAGVQGLSPLCEVGFQAGYTHNLGNMSFVKVGVSLKIPCEHSKIDLVYDYAEQWVDAKIGALKDEMPA